MARINRALLAAQVGDNVYRANLVRKDPAVVKAASQAKADTDQALRSVGALVREAGHSWARHSPVGGRPRAA
jgi:hypothetical protein